MLKAITRQKCRFYQASGRFWNILTMIVNYIYAKICYALNYLYIHYYPKILDDFLTTWYEISGDFQGFRWKLITYISSKKPCNRWNPWLFQKVAPKNEPAIIRKTTGRSYLPAWSAGQGWEAEKPLKFSDFLESCIVEWTYEHLVTVPGATACFCPKINHHLHNFLHQQACGPLTYGGYSPCFYLALC